MPNINDDFLGFLDKAAYNRPDIIPQEIMRNDKAHYRIYFKFMCCIYLLYKGKILDKCSLGAIKKDFIGDFKIYDILFKSAVKSEQERRKLAAAIIACNKNSHSCEYCKSISAFGAPTKADEPDIEVDNGN